MIRAIWIYIRDEALPRWRAVVFGSELWLAIAIGLVCGVWGDRLALAHAKVGDITADCPNVCCNCLRFLPIGANPYSGSAGSRICSKAR